MVQTLEVFQAIHQGDKVEALEDFEFDEAAEVFGVETDRRVQVVEAFDIDGPC